jgi:hypothetical protein
MAQNRSTNRYKSVLDILHGTRDEHEEDPLLEKIALCLADPAEFPFMVEGIVEDERIEEMRIALARAQIDSELRMREDVEYFTKRLWVAQTLEKMVFGGLMVEGEKLGDDEDEKD